MEQDPRDQDPFYRNYYARAEGMSLAAVNSVVHNVKHQSEGQFTIWDELPSHRVRPGYTTTTKRPKTTTTTVPWVRGRHRPQLGQQQAPWYQNDPDKYDNGYGTDYDDDAYRPPSRTRGRRPTGSRGRRPPAPTAPVRVQVGKGDELVENEDGGGFAAIEEGVKADVDAEGLAKPEEGMKMVTTTEKPTTQTVAKTTATTKKILVKKKEKEDESEGSKDEVPYPDDHGYTHSMTPTTPTHPAETIGDDYHSFENMDCKEVREDKTDEDGESEEKPKTKKSKKSKKSRKKKDKKTKNKKRKGNKENNVSLDYLTSKEKIDEDDEDLKKIRKNTEPQENGIDCSTAVDEFPLKCGAWKSAGFCETNQATQFLWCRKTCICSLMHIRTTSTSSPNSRE
ncbi:hypothetical protein L3Y34_018574 [Caenorhabditis briggsae]|uniref:ShKT domain-containing protein n=1 Tax=Caenorhabditis briggsae TaxID=6238 RepID=A0AAE9IUW0_CAEBR|nr:hypothetical protein L3Y34_018574 [Caenorhabditis briggsae]